MTIKIEVKSSFNTPAPFQETTQCHTPKDHTLYTQCNGNFISHKSWHENKTLQKLIWWKQAIFLNNMDAWTGHKSLHQILLFQTLLQQNPTLVPMHIVKSHM